MTTLDQPTTPPTPAGPQRLRLELWSDLICPWCYLGEHRLGTALAAAGRTDEVDLTLRSFELNPAPQQPMPILEMLAAKMGRPIADVARMEQQVADLVAAEGLPFNPDRMNSNTFDLHRVQQLAADHGVGPQFFRTLQRAYFAAEVSPYDHDVLTRFAVEAGVPADEVTALLAAADPMDEYGRRVRKDEATARQIGITGVPFLVLDGRLAVAGAQSVEAYASALDRARRELAEV